MYSIGDTCDFECDIENEYSFLLKVISNVLYRGHNIFYRYLFNLDLYRPDGQMWR